MGRVDGRRWLCGVGMEGTMVALPGLLIQRELRGEIYITLGSSREMNV
jgi:hypothetical protein